VLPSSSNSTSGLVLASDDSCSLRPAARSQTLAAPLPSLTALSPWNRSQFAIGFTALRSARECRRQLRSPQVCQPAGLGVKDQPADRFRLEPITGDASLRPPVGWPLSLNPHARMPPPWPRIRARDSIPTGVACACRNRYRCPAIPAFFAVRTAVS